MGEEFEAAVEETKRLEKKLLGYSPYSGEVEVVHTLDLEPKDYVDLTYQDLLNLHERAQKIISATGMEVFAAEGAKPKEAAPKPTVKTEEVEARLTQMTTETLEKAEEIKNEEILFEREAPVEAPEKFEIEFEHRPTKPEIEKVEEKAPELEKPEVVEEKPQEAPPEEIKAPVVEKPPERKMVMAAVPPSLRESPDEAASKRYDQIEEQIRSALGGATDEMTLKKKMLELTKELFKEKSVNKRERIKLEITVLKNMLAGGEAGARRKKGGEEAETHSRMLETLVSTQQSDLAQTKDSIIGSYRKQTGSIKKKFYDDMVAAGDDTIRRKQIFEGFVFALTSLVEQLPGVIKKYQDFTLKKHVAEIEKLRGSLGAKEKDVDSKSMERVDSINKTYDGEFAAVKSIIGHDIDNMIEAAGREIFKKAEGEKEDADAKARDIVIEINETDEGTLLYYLHSKDAEYYRKYEHKQVSKAEAIFRAKALMAKERKLSDDMIKKHFSGAEG